MATKEKVAKPNPRYFTIKLEVLAPVTLTYKILAENPEEALAKVEKNIANGMIAPPKPNLGRSKKIKGDVYHHGMSVILKNKRY